ncbi:hypothetical protein [Vulcanisaeta distributa]|uniref:hypothetical protein n=1 Tax=Vulcanisaeta distributa TaxID=164451 RepID=UPI001FB26ACE|nr:hypothetical protein [Vulcanisaeta distributa]
MGSRLGFLLVITVMILALADALLIAVLLKPSVISSVINDIKGAVKIVLSTTYKFELMRQGVAKLSSTKPQPLALPVTAYVVGSSQFINGLVSAGASESMIRPITLGELSSVPNDSIIIIDWNYINETMHTSLSQLARQLENVIGRGDLVILYTASPGWVLPLEDAIAVAWGNHYHSTVIGYPVMAVNTSTYITAFGGKNYLVISPVQVSNEYAVTLNGLIGYWMQISGVLTNQSQSLRLDPTYYDQDLCTEILNTIESQNLNEWLFMTGLYKSQVDSYTGDYYLFDYCITGTYKPSGTLAPPGIPVSYLGFNNLVTGSGGSGGNWAYYRVGVNMTTAYYIDQENGYNSYMTWTGTDDEPGSTSCSWLSTSVLQVIEQIGSEILQFIYDAASASDPSNPVYSLTASVTTINSAQGTSNIVWSIGIENQNWFCTPEQTQADYEYPVGFGVVNSQGYWYVNPSTVNTAASPVLFSEGSICFPWIDNYYLWESFGSEVYFVLQYNPSATYTVSLQRMYTVPLGFFYNYMTSWITTTCPG